MNVIASLSPTSSAIPPMIKGTNAPPTMPVHKIPENVPWCWGTEFIPKEKIIDHMIERNRPVTGKATAAIICDPNNAHTKEIRHPDANTIRIRLLSKSFNSPSPKKHPTVINPQKYEIAVAPPVAGSTPWYN